MPKETVLARAKLNLTLDVLGKRPDGYHDLKMVMQSVELSDTLTVETGTGEDLKVRTDLSFLPNNEKNLAAAAALAFQAQTGRDLGGVAIAIEKHIPVCAGMGGGSSDAAAVLRALNGMLGAGYVPLDLARIGEAVGSDVPYCVRGGTALAEGRGEILTPLPALPPGATWSSASRPSPSPPRSSSGRWTGCGSGAAPTPTGSSPPWRRGTWGVWPGGCTTSLRTCCPPGSAPRSGASGRCWYSMAPWAPT